MRGRIQFDARLEQGHKGVAAVIVPFDPRTQWGQDPIALDDRRQGWLVRGKVNGAAFDGWIGHRWGRHFIILDPALRAAARVAIGDTVSMIVEPTRSAAALDVAHEQARLTTAPPRARGSETAAQRLARLLGAFGPEVAARARGVLAAMRKLAPGAVETVSEGKATLVVGFGASERAAAAIVSIAVDPRGVALRLPAGKPVRSRRLERGARTLAEPEMKALVTEALRRARPPIDPTQKRRLLFK